MNQKIDTLLWMIEHKPAKQKTDIEKQEAFDNWMANVVRSSGYSDNEQMCNAYQRITEVNEPVTTSV